MSAKSIGDARGADETKQDVMLGILYAFRRMHWADRFALPHYRDRCLLLDMQILEHRHIIASLVFMYDGWKKENVTRKTISLFRRSNCIRQLRITPLSLPDYTQQTTPNLSQPTT